jgi:hypothetical protein
VRFSRYSTRTSSAPSRLVSRCLSDSDVIGCAADRSIIAALLWGHFPGADGFGIYQ